MKGNETKPRVGIFGRRNVGKSSLLNYLIGQQLAIVDSTPGTTTDPVRKTMEVAGVGPVVLVDTAGLDDEGELGMQRVEKTMKTLAEVDAAILLFTQWGEPEEMVTQWCAEHDTPMLFLRGKADMAPGFLHSRGSLYEDFTDPQGHTVFNFSIYGRELHERMMNRLRELIPSRAYCGERILAGIVDHESTVVLVTPIDSSAPEGRMILPQVQVLRDVMDVHGRAVVCQPEELEGTLRSLPEPPTLVVTDSQAFAAVAKVVPDEVPLTSFSILLARHKGLFDEFVQGTQAIGRLDNEDRVLLMESCSHIITCEDIGRVKLPAALWKATGKALVFDVLGGQSETSEAPMPLEKYAMVIQCGGCFITHKQLAARLQPALDLGLPVSNYGMAMAWCHGIYERATRIFR